MTSTGKIETYVRELSRALSILKEKDRDDILLEIRSHLEHREEENRLDEALASLGSAKECARGFFEEIRLQHAFTDGGPTKTIGALLALASRRITAAFGLLAAGIFYLMSVGFALTAIAEVVAPELAGLWINSDKGIFFFGVIDPATTAAATEVLGGWVIPVAAILAVLSFICGQWLGRFFIRLMMRNRTDRMI